jgi:hypothetical protein
MKSKINRFFSPETRNNYLIDMPMLVAGMIAILSGIYFLFLPVGGFQGGRNPNYGLVILFERHTWSDIHMWSSVVIMALAVIHIPLHWDWITKMTRNGARAVFGKSRLNKFSKFNLFINVMIGLSGLICGFSGLYFLYEPVLIPLGSDGWLVSGFVWDMVHTWSGIMVTAAAILHFAIHWRWVTKVTSKYWKGFLNQVITPRTDDLRDAVRVIVGKTS